jgi:hypothetical protein
MSASSAFPRDHWLGLSIVANALNEATGNDDRAEAARAWFTDDNDEFRYACWLIGKPPMALRHFVSDTLGQRDASDRTGRLVSQLESKRPSPERIVLPLFTLAIETPTPRKKITFDEQTLSIAEWARRLGITASALSLRLKKWGVEKSLTTRRCPIGRAKKRYQFRGELLTISEISQRTGIRFKALYSRVSRGWPIERAVSQRARLIRPFRRQKRYDIAPPSRLPPPGESQFPKDSMGPAAKHHAT